MYYHNIGSNGFDVLLGKHESLSATVERITAICLTHGVEVKSITGRNDGDFTKVTIEFTDDHTEDTLESILKELC